MPSVLAADGGEPRLLKISGLETGYGPVQILHGVDMEVPRGQIVALLGGNGTGKSTMLRAISGLLPVWKGGIEFDGERIENLSPDRIVRRGLIQVTQGKDSYPAMTVQENLEVGAFIRNDKAAIARDMERVYDYFPVLKERRKQLAATLSGGEVQMLVIGRGLMAGPKMMLLDEPSSALAPKVVLEIFANINRIARSGVTVLVVEQNVRMALILANYAYIIRDGKILIKGNARDLIDDENVKMSFLGGTVADSSRGYVA